MAVPTAKITKSDVLTYDQVTHFVSKFYMYSHFAVLLYDCDHHVVVYDGLPCRLAKWEPRISYTLRKHGLQDYNDMPHVKVTRGTYGEEVLKLRFSDLTEMPWLVSKDPNLKQHDGINCEPIACMKVLEIYGVIPKNFVEAAPKIHPKGYR